MANDDAQEVILSTAQFADRIADLVVDRLMASFEIRPKSDP